LSLTGAILIVIAAFTDGAGQVILDTTL